DSQLLRHLAEILAYRQHGMPDQPGILHRRLAMLHRFAVDRIADHLDESGNAWIFGNEAMIPALVLRADQHSFEWTLADDLATKPREHRAALAAIGGIGFRACRRAAVGID